MSFRQYRIVKQITPRNPDATRWFWQVALEYRTLGGSWYPAYDIPGTTSDNGYSRTREKAERKASKAEGLLRAAATRANATAMRVESESRQDVIPL